METLHLGIYTLILADELISMLVSFLKFSILSKVNKDHEFGSSNEYPKMTLGIVENCANIIVDARALKYKRSTKFEAAFVETVACITLKLNDRSAPDYFRNFFQTSVFSNIKLFSRVIESSRDHNAH